MTTSHVHCLSSVSPYSPKCLKPQTGYLKDSRFLSSDSSLKLKNPSLFRSVQLSRPNCRPIPVVSAVQSNFWKVIQTVWKVGKDGIEAGTKLVPGFVPRPIARISVTVVALSLALFVLRSFLSTAFFVLATMGLSYFIFIALNKDDGPKGGSGTDSPEDSLEEARRIMEKYNFQQHFHRGLSSSDQI